MSLFSLCESKLIEEYRLSKKFVPTLARRIIRCMLFDLGSTLWTDKEDFDRIAHQQKAQQIVVALLHQHFAPQFFPHLNDATLGEPIIHAIHQRIYEMYLLDTGHEPDFAAGVIEALQQVGFPPIKRAVAEEIFEALRTRSFDSRMLFNDALTTLAALKQRGFLLGVVTNRQYGGSLFVEDMQNFGLLNYFKVQHVAVSADLRVRKPNPVIFQHALDALDVPAQEAAMVGDSLGADVVGSHNLGMFTVWKPHPLLFAEARARVAEHERTPSLQEYVVKDMFSRAKEFEQGRGRAIPDDLQPDLVIEHLSELLDVFQEAGEQ